MATTNDITGDRIATKSATKAYRDNYDLIFGKKEPLVEKKEPLLEMKDGEMVYTEAGKQLMDETLATVSNTLSNMELEPRFAVQPMTAPTGKVFKLKSPDTVAPLTFTVSAAEGEKIEQWLKTEVYPEIIAEQKLDKNYPSFAPYMGENGEEYPYQGAIGGGVSYSFTPTSIGTIVKVQCHGKELDVTDYNSF